MHHLISNIGLKFSLFELQGTLTYEHTRIGRPPKQHEISETDLEDASDSESSDSGALVPVKSGIDASASGIRLRLIKNDGHLRMGFEGKDGSTAEWTFNGMGADRMVASGGTQTPSDADECVMCGHRAITESQVKHVAVQTDVVSVHEVTFSAEAGSQTTITGVSLELDTIKDSTQKPTNDGFCQTDLTISKQLLFNATTDILVKTNKERKRKTSSAPHMDVSAHKRAKSSHDSKPWPKVIYMDCERFYPTKKGDTGRLVINTEEGTVWYEDSHGKSHARTIEHKQVDIKSASTKVIYTVRPSHIPNSSAHEPTHLLQIERLTKAEVTHEIAKFHCSAPNWKTWYDDPHIGRFYINDAEVVVDAIVHCIDRTSGREAVHDPDGEYRLQQEMALTTPDLPPFLPAAYLEDKERYKVYRPDRASTV